MITNNLNNSKLVSIQLVLSILFLGSCNIPNSHNHPKPKKAIQTSNSNLAICTTIDKDQTLFKKPPFLNPLACTNCSGLTELTSNPYPGAKNFEEHAAIKDSCIPTHSCTCEDIMVDVTEYLVKNGANTIPVDNGCVLLSYDHAMDYLRYDITAPLQEHRVDNREKKSQEASNLYSLSMVLCNSDLLNSLNAITAFVKDIVDINMTDNDGRTILHHAAMCGCLEVVELLLDHGAIVDVFDNQCMTPLHRAAASGHEDIVRFLLEKGANIDVVDLNGCTPLYLAAKNSYFNVILVLIQYGADTMSFLYVAALDKNVYAINILKEDFVLDSYDTIIQFLLKEGIAGINITLAEIGYTPLQYAVIRDCAPAVELLLRKGADINTIAQGRKTPLYFAAFNGSIKVVRILLKYGAQIIAKNNGETPFHTAIRKGHISIVELLLSHPEVDVNQCNDAERSPLDLAVWYNNTDIVKLLLTKGKNINPNTCGHWGYTPLYYAVRRRNADVVRWLLEAGANPQADIKVGPERGVTPLDLASRHEDTLILKILTEFSNDLNRLL